MHTITIKETVSGLFDVLTNGFSYRIHRAMDEQAAKKRAKELKDEFRKIGQKAVIEWV